MVGRLLIAHRVREGWSLWPDRPCNRHGNMEGRGKVRRTGKARVRGIHDGAVENGGAGRGQMGEK